MGSDSSPPDNAWLPAVARWAGGPVTVTGRAALTGGYVADAVQRVDLEVDGRAVSVVVKRGPAVEVAALRAVAVVRGVPGPRLLATGHDTSGHWLVTPHRDGPPLAEGPDVPSEVWTALARVHAHWLGKRPRGVPVADVAWWRALCVERILPHALAAHARTGDDAYARAAAAVRDLAEDPRMHAATALLPRTLVHGDAHRGNVLLAPGGAVLIDWGNAKVAPPGLDLAVLRAQGATDTSPYDRAFADLAGPPPPARAAVEAAWADVRAHVGYLGFAADHLGAARVTELVDGALGAVRDLGAALATLAR